MDDEKRNFVIAIEGNTGCGKSKLLQWLSTFPSVQIYTEPVEQWRNFAGHNLLEMRYADPKRWCFAFQSLVQLSRMKMYPDADEKINEIRFIERTLHSNRYCFLEAANEAGHLSEVEYALLTEWFNYLEKEIRTRTDLIIYLQTSPEVAFNRIRARYRSEEKAITLDQLEKIHVKYESWISGGASGLKVIIIDADKSESAVQQSVLTYLRQNVIHFP